MKLGETKVGLSQTSKPAPLNYRKFLNAMIIVVLPATTSYIMIFKLSEETKYIIAQSVVYFTAILKAIGMVLGNGQQYSPSNESIEKEQSKNIKD